MITLKQLKAIEGLTAYTATPLDTYSKRKDDYLIALYDVLDMLHNTNDNSKTIDTYKDNGEYHKQVTFSKDTLYPYLERVTGYTIEQIRQSLFNQFYID